MTAPVQVGPPSVDGGPVPVLPRLTPRQLQVLQLAANGRTNREIGRHLGTTEDTVKSQMAVVLRRLHVEDRTQAVAVGIRVGLVSLDTVTISPRPPRFKRQAPVVDVEKSAFTEELEEQLADVGDRIRAERKARGWSQVELAQRASLGTRALGSLEVGRPTLLSTLVLACRALGVDMGHVMSTDWRMPEIPDRSLALTPQQVRVLRAARVGGSLSQIGARLDMTSAEVGSTLTRVYQRLDVTHRPRGERRAAAVRVAMQHNLLDAA